MKPELFKLLTILLFAGLFSNICAQHKISFEIDNYENDTLIIGYYILDKQLVHDTLYAGQPGKFVLEDTLKEGVYLTLTFPDKQFLQFVVNDTEKQFSMHFDYMDKSHVEFKGSRDNQAFQSYVEYINSIRPKADSLREMISHFNETGEDATPTENELRELNATVNIMLDSLIETNPEYMSTILLKANKEVELPEFGKSEEERLKQYLYYKEHYFDNIDLSDPRVLRTPFLFQRLNYYIDKLTPKNPDSINNSLDSLLKWIEPSEEAFRFYLSHFLNEFAQPKIVGLDAVYVHLVENYYKKDKAPWVSEENMLKIVDRAEKLKPVLIGKTGADIEVYLEDGTPISISDIDYEYLVLMFWAPDCGHCKKSMPDFVAFNEKFKDKGIKTLAICSKYRDKVEGCWESVKEKGMEGFINAADPYNKSNFKLKYFVDSTPKVYILDPNREIIMKNIGAQQLESVFDEIYRRKAAEEGSSDQ